MQSPSSGPIRIFRQSIEKRNSRKSVGYRSTATARTTQAPWCLQGPAWLLPPTNPALARPWDRQTGSPAHRSQLHVGSAMGCRRPLAHRPSAARQIRPGPPPLSPNCPPCAHLTLGYASKLVNIEFSDITQLILCFGALTSLARSYRLLFTLQVGLVYAKRDPRKGDQNDRSRSPPLPHRRSRRGSHRPPPTHRGHAVARKGDGRRQFAGRAARDDAGTRPLLGNGL